jgi:hypothetical protein
MVIGTDCIDSCKFNYHTITTMTAPLRLRDVKTPDIHPQDITSIAMENLNFIFVSKNKPVHSSEVYSIQQYVIKFCQQLAVGRWFSPVSSINKTDRYVITEILLKGELNTITLTPCKLSKRYMCVAFFRNTGYNIITT